MALNSQAQPEAHNELPACPRSPAGTGGPGPAGSTTTRGPHARQQSPATTPRTATLPSSLLPPALQLQAAAAAVGQAALAPAGAAEPALDAAAASQKGLLAAKAP